MSTIGGLGGIEWLGAGRSGGAGNPPFTPMLQLMGPKKSASEQAQSVTKDGAADLVALDIPPVPKIAPGRWLTLFPDLALKNEPFRKELAQGISACVDSVRFSPDILRGMFLLAKECDPQVFDSVFADRIKKYGGWLWFPRPQEAIEARYESLQHWVSSAACHPGSKIEWPTLPVIATADLTDRQNDWQTKFLASKNLLHSVEGRLKAVVGVAWVVPLGHQMLDQSERDQNQFINRVVGWNRLPYSIFLDQIVSLVVRVGPKDLSADADSEIRSGLSEILTAEQQQKVLKGEKVMVRLAAGVGNYLFHGQGGITDRLGQFRELNRASGELSPEDLKVVLCIDERNRCSQDFHSRAARARPLDCEGHSLEYMADGKVSDGEVHQVEQQFTPKDFPELKRFQEQGDSIFEGEDKLPTIGVNWQVWLTDYGRLAEEQASYRSRLGRRAGIGLISG